MEIREDLDGLYERASSAHNNLKKAKSAEERVAIANYIANLYGSIRDIAGTNIYPTKKLVFGSNKNYHKFNKKLNIYEDRMLKNYLQNKKYHHKQIGSILEAISNPLDSHSEDIYIEGKVISKEEFFDIFFLFLKSLKLDKYYDKFMRDIDIYSYPRNTEDTFRGYILYNPINKDTDIFVGDFDYDASSLYTLAHEFGHAYDFTKLDGDIDIYNKYFYQSFYGEVTSKLFERLLVEYLIKNNILLGDAKEELLSMEFDNYTNLIFSYIISLFSDDDLKVHRQEKVSIDYIYSIIKDDFEESIKDILENKNSLTIEDNYVYAYGDIISMIIKERVFKDSIDNDILEDLYTRRGEIFDREFLEKHDINTDSYVKAYQKELKLLKK